MKALFLLFLNADLWGSVLILLALLLRPFLRKAPRYILCVLWLLVILRLLIPVGIESNLSLQPQYIPSQSIAEQTVPQPDLPPAQGSVPAPDIVPDTPVDPVPPIQSEIPADRPALDPVTVIAVIWFSIAGAILIYNWISYGVLLQRVRESTPGTDGVLESDKIPGAFLLGYWKPKIYLPVGLSQQDRRFIIAHEQAHIRRGDNGWKLLGMLCLCIHWYNPLVGFSYILMCRDIEVACDERVIRTMPMEERKAYSMALLNSGKRMSGFFITSAAFGEINLKQRIKKVLSYRNPGLWVTVIGIALVAFAAVCLMTNPASDTHGPTDAVIQDSTDGSEVTETMPQINNSTSESTGTVIPKPTTGSGTSTPQPEQPLDQTQGTNGASGSAGTEISKPTAGSGTSTPQPGTTSNPSHVIAGGKWNGGPVTWKITADGVLTISGNRSVQAANPYIWADYSDVVTKIVVEDGITTVPHGAFRGMDKVTEVYLSNTLKTIGKEAFYQCTALQSVTIPASVETISESAFYDCRGLTTLQIASNSSLKTIEPRAFAQSSITAFTSPASLRVIEDQAFAECNFLKSVDLRYGVEDIRGFAFAKCPNIKHLVLGESISVGGMMSFLDSKSIETVEIYAIQSGSLEDQGYLRSAVIGGNVMKIGGNFFAGCSSLTEVTITAPIMVIERGAFEGCVSLKSLQLPDLVTEIYSHAFARSGIEKITIPASVKTIYWSVFSNSKVKEIIFLGDIPQIMNNNIFSDTTATVYYPGDNPTWTQDKLQNYGGNITWVAQ